MVVKATLWIKETMQVLCISSGLGLQRKVSMGCGSDLNRQQSTLSQPAPTVVNGRTEISSTKQRGTEYLLGDAEGQQNIFSMDAISYDIF